MEKNKTGTEIYILGEVLRGSIWSTCTGLIPFVYGVFVFIRDEFLPKNIAEKLQLRGMLFTISWYWWVIAGILIFWFGTILRATKKISQLRREIKDKPVSTLASAENNSQAVTVANSPNASVNVMPSAKDITPPNIIVGLSDENGLLSQKVTIYLKPLPEKPDIEKFLEKKKDELLKEYQKEKSEDTNTVNLRLVPPSSSINVILSKTENYRKESINSYPDRVEKYLDDYKEYASDSYALSILDDRYKVLKLIVENRSPRPASMVILELYVPEEFTLSPKNVNSFVSWKQLVGRSRTVSEPEEPKLVDFEKMNALHHFAEFLYSPTRPSRDVSPGMNVIKKQQNKKILEYKIDTLIQNRPYLDLSPIPIWLDNVNQSTTWNIPVRINAIELPQPIDTHIELEFVIQDSKNQEQE